MKLSVCMVSVLGLFVLGCAEAPPPTAVASDSVLSCEPYDPSYCDPATFCEETVQYITCDDSTVFFTLATPDCRWCIERDVCADHGGPVLCP